jgi:hypothetical protein
LEQAELALERLAVSPLLEDQSEHESLSMPQNERGAANFYVLVAAAASVGDGCARSRPGE